MKPTCFSPLRSAAAALRAPARLSAAALVLLLAACGGAGSPEGASTASGATTPTALLASDAKQTAGTASAQPAGTTAQGSTNTAPVADAGTPQAAQLATTVTLDGRASRDAEGDMLQYQWVLSSRPAASRAALNAAATATPDFVPDATGRYVATLLVSDGQVASAPATVVITVKAPNGAPSAAAGVDRDAVVGAILRLDGTRSEDPNGDSLVYRWTLTTRPAGSTAVLQNPDSVQPSLVPDVAGDYVASLQVSDGRLASAPATVMIVARSLIDTTLHLVNLVRATPRQCGTEAFSAAGPLTWQPKAVEAALAQATYLRESNTFGHAGLDGSTPSDRITATGYKWSSVGENLAAGYADIEGAVKAWVESPGHCAVLMNPRFTEIGLVVLDGTPTNTYRNYWAMVAVRPL